MRIPEPASQPGLETLISLYNAYYETTQILGPSRPDQPRDAERGTRAPASSPQLSATKQHKSITEVFQSTTEVLPRTTLYYGSVTEVLQKYYRSTTDYYKVL